MVTLSKNKGKKVFKTSKDNSKTLVSFKVDKKIKKQFAELADNFGVPYSTAIVILMRKTIREKRLVLGDGPNWPVFESIEELDAEIMKGINSGFVPYEKSWLYKKQKELNIK